MSTITKTLLTSVKREISELYRICSPGTVFDLDHPFPLDPVFVYRNADGKAVGYCQVHETTPIKVEKDGEYIYNLKVLPSERNNGIATKIIKCIRDRSTPATYILSEWGIATSKPLQKNGFIPISTYKNMYVLWAAGTDLPSISVPMKKPGVSTSTTKQPDNEDTIVMLENLSIMSDISSQIDIVRPEEAPPSVDSKGRLHYDPYENILYL